RLVHCIHLDLASRRCRLVLAGFSGLHAMASVLLLRSRTEHKHPNFRMCLPRRSSKDRSSGSCWLSGMEQLFDGLFRVLDPRAVLAIVLLCFEVLQEPEERRSSRVS